MNELEIRKIAKEEFISNVMNNLDSTLIFTYIQNLEQKANNLQSKIDMAIEYIKIQQKVFKDYDIVIKNQLNNLLDILKED